MIHSCTRFRAVDLYNMKISIIISQETLWYIIVGICIVYVVILFKNLLQVSVKCPLLVRMFTEGLLLYFTPSSSN